MLANVLLIPTVKIRNYIEKARESDKYIVIAGCVPQGAPKAPYIQVNSGNINARLKKQGVDVLVVNNKKI
jgi:fructose-1-phosphate kinase PfkB-like protein